MSAVVSEIAYTNSKVHFYVIVVAADWGLRGVSEKRAGHSGIHCDMSEVVNHELRKTSVNVSPSTTHYRRQPIKLN